MGSVRSKEGYRHVFALLIFSILSFVIYSNTFSCGWHLDDTANIVKNPRLYASDLLPDELAKTFFAKPGSNRLYRPLAFASFAMNLYLDKDDPFGFHLVNTAIHATTAFLVYLAVFLLLHAPAVIERYGKEDRFSIAFLSACLWAVHPIQTQAVVYIVQRMAQMAAMFFAAGMVCYAKARLEEGFSRRAAWGALSALFFACAVMSKENAALFPLSLFLTELVFFRPAISSKRVLAAWIAVLGAVLLCGVFLFAGGNPLFFIRGYETRPFTLAQRLMTEPRVLLFYLSQILYPIPSRLSVCHDMDVSTSLFYPWTTLPSIMIIAGLVWLAVRTRKSLPLLAFAVLFYFANHIIESSVIALELVFEHRNYLPSMFLFAPVAALAVYGLDRYRKTSPLLFRMAAVCIVAVVTGLGLFTYDRNLAWRDDITLWSDALSKAPQSSRPYVNLAVALAWRDRSTRTDEDAALSLLARALGKRHDRVGMEADIYADMAMLYDRRGEYPKAVELYRTALSMNPRSTKTRHDMIKSLINMGDLKEALAQSNILVKEAERQNRTNPDYHDTRGFILLRMGRFDEAIKSFHAAMRADPYNDPRIMVHTGYALCRAGFFPRAERFFKIAQSKAPLRIETFFLLIENSERAGNRQAAIGYERELFSRFDLFSILAQLKAAGKNPSSLPLSPDIIEPVVREAFYDIGDEAKTKGVFEDG